MDAKTDSEYFFWYFAMHCRSLIMDIIKIKDWSLKFIQNSVLANHGGSSLMEKMMLPYNFPQLRRWL